MAPCNGCWSFPRNPFEPLPCNAKLGLPGVNRCVGLVLVESASATAETLWADAVVLATGGACGGVVTDTGGRTDIQHPYAVGEVSCTGLHGANRPASNSRLEALAFAKSVSGRIDAQIRQPGRGRRRTPASVVEDGIDVRRVAVAAQAVDLGRGVAIVLGIGSDQCAHGGSTDYFFGV